MSKYTVLALSVFGILYLRRLRNTDVAVGENQGDLFSYK